jgi:hypothetical protein
MIVPFSQTDVESEVSQSGLRPLPVIAIVIGIISAILFSQIWSDFHGAAAFALWPLGFATGLFTVTLGASIIHRQMHWDLLIAGKMLTLAGTVLFFIASL